ncbi:MAG TPA: hypothetical protein VN932_08310, partial [Rhizomicrobium sp.]|nr:hypothetical protein [Rhizomicrobium sp.]
AIEPRWRFYPKFAAEFVAKHVRLAQHAWRIHRLARNVYADPANLSYTDLAMTPVTDDENDNLEMFTHNEGARVAVTKERKIKALTGHPERIVATS